MPEPEDKQILDLFRDERTRNKAFNHLVEKYQKRIYWHVRKIVIQHDDADDVVQNTFIRIWHSLENFREESKLYTWIYRIATNESITFLNRKKASLYADWETVEGQLSETLEQDPYFNGDRVQLKLQQALLTLPEKQRIVFNMKYFDNMKYEDMSEILETSVGALKASYHHAVKKIEKFFNID